MRIVFISSFFLLFSAVNASGDIVYCFSAPGDNVIGLGSSIDRVWAIDDGTLQIYELDYNGSILNQFPVIGTATPTGLAWGDSVLYYADGGTAILHAMSDDGSYLGSYDFSDSGISSIRGLGFNNNIAPYLPEALLITDDVADAAFAAYPPLVFDQMELIADLSEAPDIFYDAAISLGYGSIWIACGDLYDNVQAFNLGGFTYNWHFYDINNVVGIADYLEMPTDEFLWLSDPDTDLISLVYYGMSIEESSGSFSNLKLEASPNPFSISVTVSVPGLIDTTSNLQIFDLSGRLVTEIEPIYDSGEAIYQWNGRSTSGAELPDGIYSARLSSGDISSVVMLLKL
ncbi:MAG: hypothetical protein K8R76_03560 [Candidatus Aegiribacteria sp.]|nr:hypothetical protein [Candidatus Aegiribacteria sp.]